ncbi:MAG: HAD family hydrolase [Gaiellaceae bacterium]
MSLPPGFPSEVEAFACDLDRTLLPETLVLGERTRAAIRAARAAGIHVLIVTGRVFQSVRPYALELGLDDPVVCYQGAVVAEPASGRFLRHIPIPLELARETIAAVEAEGFRLNCYVDDELYVAEATPESERYARFQNLVVHPVGDLLAWLEAPPTKLVTVDDPEKLDRLEVDLKRSFAGRLYISKSLPYFLEFASPEVTKGSGLGFLAEHLGFPAERTVAFGDGENDLELLDWAAYGIAVEDAHEHLLAIADATCPPAGQEGVAQMIEAYLERLTK